MKLITSMSLALLIMAEVCTTSGKLLRVEEPNIPLNATLTSLGFSNDDHSVRGDTKVMMVERLAGQGRVAWIGEWKEAWLDERFMKKREADDVKAKAWRRLMMGQKSLRSAEYNRPIERRVTINVLTIMT